MYIRASLMRTRSYTERYMPGWNTYVRERHDAARSAYLDWLAVGKPRYGYCFESMKRTRATFTLAVRYCKNNIEQIKADACAVSMLDKDSRKFWNSVYRMNNIKANKNIVNVGGAVSAQNIAKLWKVHFSKLYNSITESQYMSKFHHKIESLQLSRDDSPITVLDVGIAIKQQKLGKASGPDGICMEAYKYGGHRLRVYCLTCV